MANKHGSYDEIVDLYVSQRKRLGSNKYLQWLLRHLKKSSTILDIGCGAGYPSSEMITKSGHTVIGLDVSKEMIKRARYLCKAGDFHVEDINDLYENEYEVDAVICLYTMFHVDRSKHGRVLGLIGTYLKRGGMLLVTMGDREYEGYANYLGTKMWWSQWGTKRNLELIESAGFEVLSNEMDVSGGERHQVILARKISD